jgi:hypothetical protein
MVKSCGVGILPARPIQIIQIKYTTADELGNNFNNDYGGMLCFA